MFDALVARRMLHPGLQVVHATDAPRPARCAGGGRCRPRGDAVVRAPCRLRPDAARPPRRGGPPRLRHRRQRAGRLHRHVRPDAARGPDHGRGEAQRDGRAATPAARTSHPGRAGALGLDAEVGSLAPGRQADLQVVRLDGLNLAGFDGGDPFSLLVYSGRPENVALVMVGARVVKREGHLVGMDVPTLLDRARRSFRAVQARAG